MCNIPTSVQPCDLLGDEESGFIRLEDEFADDLTLKSQAHRNMQGKIKHTGTIPGSVLNRIAIPYAAFQRLHATHVYNYHVTTIYYLFSVSHFPHAAEIWKTNKGIESKLRAFEVEQTRWEHRVQW